MQKETEIATKIQIIVNGREKHLFEDEVTFTEIVLEAFDPIDDNAIYTVTYKGGPKKKPQGTMTAGDVIEVQKGMIFNVTPTNKS